MKKINKTPLQKTIGFAATIALLGASLGVDVAQVWAAQANDAAERAPDASSGKQRGTSISAHQLKMERGNAANQLKFEKGTKGSMTGATGDSTATAKPGDAKMLNPQPFPPKKNKTGNVGQLPSIQK